MNKILATLKYLFYDFIKGMMIYYGIILGICVVLVLLYLQFWQSVGGRIGMSFSNISVIFIFIAGLNSFKNSFKFLQANNVTRKSFYIASIILFAGVSALMTLIDWVIFYSMRHITHGENIYEQLYNANSSFLPAFAISTAFMSMTVTSGFFITMLYYKCSSLMKVIVSISPGIVFAIIFWLDTTTDGAIAAGLLRFASAALGVNPFNPNMAVLSFSILFAAAAALSYLLLRRMTIKD